MESPASEIRFIHKGISHELAGLEEAAQSLSVGDDLALSQFAKRLAFLRGIVKAHAEGEEADMYPALEERSFPVSAAYLMDHEIEQSISGEMTELVERCRTGERAERDLALKRLRRQAIALNVTLSAHIRKEEELLVPLFDQHFSMEEQGSIIGRAMSYYTEEQLRAGIPWVVEALSPEERSDYVHALQRGLPEARFRQIAAWIKDGVSDEVWRDVARQVPQLNAA